MCFSRVSSTAHRCKPAIVRAQDARILRLRAEGRRELLEIPFCDIWEPGSGAGHWAKDFANHNRLAAASDLINQVYVKRYVE